MWEFSSTGWQDSVREFVVSAGKTVLAAAVGALVTYLLSKLSYFEAHLSIADHYYAYEATFAVLARACISSLLNWVNTYTADPAPAADTTTIG